MFGVGTFAYSGLAEGLVKYYLVEGSTSRVFYLVLISEAVVAVSADFKGLCVVLCSLTKSMQNG